MIIDHNRDENYLSPSIEDTDEEWTYLLSLCEKKKSIGFGELDSFLSGPDIKKRISLVEEEIKTNNSFQPTKTCSFCDRAQSLD